MAGSDRTLADLDIRVGNVALDFANTVNSRSTFEHDYIASHPDLLAWARRVGLLPAEPEGSHGPARAAELDAADERADVRILRRAHRLREAIFRTFSAIAADAPPPALEVRHVLRAYGQAVALGSFRRDVERPPIHWPPSAALVLEPIAYAAGALLLAPDRPSIKECPGCGWLFLDNSRNGSRRWCDMRICGSRDKMRRYRSRPPV